MNPIILKIDLFMKLHILPHFNPEKIHWVFSLSGGKDSYVMCKGLCEWYKIHNYSFKASGIHIWQWGNEHPQKNLKSIFPWLKDIQVIDARNQTAILKKNDTQLQAPCRACSDIRHHFSDIYIEQLNTNNPILLCRGLHLTDMVISLLWRLVWYGSITQLERKGKPIIKLTSNSYLVKPLCYAREYESQLFAKQNNFIPIHCECPAHVYPSRRDIIEESVRQFYTSALWEFDVPGSTQYLQDTTGFMDIAYLQSISLPGHEIKENIIPNAYYTFAKNYFLKKYTLTAPPSSSILLEKLYFPFLTLGKQNNISSQSYHCKLFSTPDSLSSFELRMIGTLGPFWASFTLPPHQRAYFDFMHKEIWGFETDINWSQVCSLLKLYYALKQ